MMKRLERLLVGGVTSSILASALMLAPVSAGAVSVTIGYQPMVSTGLAANQPFEAWLVLDKPADPNVPGYAVPAGAKVRLTFGKAFTPVANQPHLDGALLHGWPHGAIAVPLRCHSA